MMWMEFIWMIISILMPNIMEGKISLITKLGQLTKTLAEHFPEQIGEEQMSTNS